MGCFKESKTQTPVWVRPDCSSAAGGHPLRKNGATNPNVPVCIEVAVSASSRLHMKGSLLFTDRRALVKKVVCPQMQVVFSWCR